MSSNRLRVEHTGSIAMVDLERYDLLVLDGSGMLYGPPPSAMADGPWVFIERDGGMAIVQDTSTRRVEAIPIVEIEEHLEANGKKYPIVKQDAIVSSEFSEKEFVQLLGPGAPGHFGESIVVERAEMVLQELFRNVPKLFDEDEFGHRAWEPGDKPRVRIRKAESVPGALPSHHTAIMIDAIDKPGDDDDGR